MPQRPHDLKKDLQSVTKSETVIGLRAEVGQWREDMIAATVPIAKSENMTTGNTRVRAIMNRHAPTMEGITLSNVTLVQLTTEHLNVIVTGISEAVGQVRVTHVTTAGIVDSRKEMAKAASCVTDATDLVTARMTAMRILTQTDTPYHIEPALRSRGPPAEGLRTASLLLRAEITGPRNPPRMPIIRGIKIRKTTRRICVTDQSLGPQRARG
jgi:hypothetical protein